MCANTCKCRSTSANGGMCWSSPSPSSQCSQKKRQRMVQTFHGAVLLRNSIYWMISQRMPIIDIRSIFRLHHYLGCLHLLHHSIHLWTLSSVLRFVRVSHDFQIYWRNKTIISYNANFKMFYFVSSLCIVMFAIIIIDHQTISSDLWRSTGKLLLAKPMSEDSWFTSRLWQACLFSLAPYDIASTADSVLKLEQAIINKNDCSCLRLNSKEQEWITRPINCVCHNCIRVAIWAWTKYIVRQKTKGLIHIYNRYFLHIKGLRDLSGGKSH